MTFGRSRSHGIDWRYPLLVAVVGALAYLNTIPNGFALDDVPIVRDNPKIRSLGGVPSLFLEPYWPDRRASGLYRPVTASSYAIGRALAGPGPAGFHAVNVLLHAVVCAMVWFVARRAGTYYGTALLTGLLFAVHPVHSEAVANIVGRAEILAALGVLCAWVAHRRSAEAGSTRSRFAWGAAAALAYLLAVLSKEHAVVAPVVFLVHDALIAREARGQPSSRVRPVRYVAYAGALAVALVLRVSALGGMRGAETAAFIDNPAAAGGTWVRIATALWVHVKGAWLMVWPARLSSDYSHAAIAPVESVTDPRLLAGCLLLVGLAVLAVRGSRGRGTIALGAAAWLLFLLPSSNLLFSAGTIMGERLLYLPSLGFCLLAGHAGAWAASRAGGPERRLARLAPVLAVLVAVIAALLARTVVRNPAWKDNLTLALADVRTVPRSAKLHGGAAIALHEEGDLARAATHYAQALRIYPDYAQMHYNYGVLLEAVGRVEEAAPHYRRAAEISPANPRPPAALARVLFRQGRVEESLPHFEAAADLEIANHELGVLHVRALLRVGRDAEARRLCRRLLQRADLSAEARAFAERVVASSPEP